MGKVNVRRQTSRRKPRKIVRAPRFQVSVALPAACKCCGVPVFGSAGVEPKWFITITPELTAFIDAVGKAAYLKEAERQGRAAVLAYQAAKAAEPETGDAKISRLLSEARALFAAGNRLSDDAKADAKYEAARAAINAACETAASGIAGVAAKLALIEQGDRGWSGGWGVAEMIRAAHADMQRLMRRSADLPATDAEIKAWHSSMRRAGQFPKLWNDGPSVNRNGVPTGPDLEQITVAGRRYDNARDRDRWVWMRKHQSAVMAWLKSNGFAVKPRLVGDAA